MILYRSLITDSACASVMTKICVGMMSCARVELRTVLCFSITLSCVIEPCLCDTCDLLLLRFYPLSLTAVSIDLY